MKKKQKPKKLINKKKQQLEKLIWKKKQTIKEYYSLINDANYFTDDLTN